MFPTQISHLFPIPLLPAKLYAAHSCYYYTPLNLNPIICRLDKSLLEFIFTPFFFILSPFLALFHYCLWQAGNCISYDSMFYFGIAAHCQLAQHYNMVRYTFFYREDAAGMWPSDVRASYCYHYYFYYYYYCIVFSSGLFFSLPGLGVLRSGEYGC